MATMTTTKLSSKGQVIIPEKIRNQLHLNTNSQFVVYAQDDTVFFKLIAAPPPKDDIKAILTKARAAVKKAGLTKKDLEKEIKLYRRSRKKSHSA